MKKTTITKILLAALLLSLITPFHTKAGGLKSEYTYIMQVGNKEVGVQKDQEEFTTFSLSYPIVINKECMRSGIAIEAFHDEHIPTIILEDSVFDEDTHQTLFTFYHTSGLYKTEFKLLYPDGKAWVERSKIDQSKDAEVEVKELTLPFKPYSVNMEEGSDEVIIIPLRIMFEEAGYHQIDWDPVTQTIFIKYRL